MTALGASARELADAAFVRYTEAARAIGTETIAAWIVGGAPLEADRTEGLVRTALDRWDEYTALLDAAAAEAVRS